MGYRRPKQDSVIITSRKDSINKLIFISNIHLTKLVHSCTLEEWSEFFPVQIHHFKVVVLQPKPKKMLNHIASQINPVRNKNHKN